MLYQPHQFLQSQPHPKQYIPHTRKPDGRPREASAHDIERLFIGALVKAGRCSRYGARHPARRTTNAFGPAFQCPRPGIRPIHTGARNHKPAHAVAAYDVTKEELRSLIPQYSVLEDEFKSNEVVRLAHDIKHHTGEDPSARVAVEDTSNRTTGTNNSIVAKLVVLSKQEDPSHEELFRLYEALPDPRPPSLPRKVMRSLLHHLSTVEYKSEIGMRRYLTVFEDVKASGRYLTISEWASAIAFAGRHVRRISAPEVESALRLWKEMENTAGIAGNEVVFSTLFDIASKAGKFVLAEMILAEMTARDVPSTRHHLTNLIYYAGLRRNGQAVRAAYAAFVEAGEFVDGTVVACVVTSLLHCGEAVAAEQVFTRSIALHEEKLRRDAKYSISGIKTMSHWKVKRSYGRELARAAAIFRRLSSEHVASSRLQGSSDPSQTSPDVATQRATFQEAISLEPDIAAYKALVYYYAVTAGDLDRVTSLIAEMSSRNISLRGVLFLHLLKGFSAHGGVLYSAWTRRQLENTWMAFCEALDAEGCASDAGDGQREPEPDSILQHRPRYSMHMSKSMAQVALRAFAKVADVARAREAWGEILQRWRPSDNDRADVEGLLDILSARENRDRDVAGAVRREGDEEAARIESGLAAEPDEADD